MQNFGHLKNKEGFLDLMKNSFLAGSYFVLLRFTVTAFRLILIFQNYQRKETF